MPMCGGQPRHFPPLLRGPGGLSIRLQGPVTVVGVQADSVAITFQH